MALNKHRNMPVEPGMQSQLGVPQSQYIPLADVAFSPMTGTVVMPQALPPSSMQFPAAWYNGMLNIPSVHVLYDERRNGVAF